jgi:hypothetical protein
MSVIWVRNRRDHTRSRSDWRTICRCLRSSKHTRSSADILIQYPAKHCRYSQHRAVTEFTSDRDTDRTRSFSQIEIAQSGRQIRCHSMQMELAVATILVVFAGVFLISSDRERSAVASPSPVHSTGATTRTPGRTEPAAHAVWCDVHTSNGCTVAANSLSSGRKRSIISPVVMRST